MLRRFGFVILANLAITFTVVLIANLLGVGGQGYSVGGIAVISFLYGSIGSLFSLLMSKKLAKWTMGLSIIDESVTDPSASKIYNSIRNLSMKANLPKMPEVAIYNSPEVNAFATGPSKSNSLVAVSTGLLSQMSDSEIEGVLAHEVSHIANGDMVTMTLIQGVINSFVIFFAKILGWAVAQFLRGDEEEGPSFIVAYIAEMVFYMILGVLGSMIAAWFSRQREYRADAGGAYLAGTGKMIGALQSLQKVSEHGVESKGEEAIASLKISHVDSWLSLLSTHPPLESRIAQLRQGV